MQRVFKASGHTRLTALRVRIRLSANRDRGYTERLLERLERLGMRLGSFTLLELVEDLRSAMQ